MEQASYHATMPQADVGAVLHEARSQMSTMISAVMVAFKSRHLQ